MSKTYERSSTGIYGGERTGWGDAKWGSYRPTGGTGTTNRWQGQSSNPPDKYYYVTNILFNSSELAALRDKASIITSVKLKITVTSGDIPPSGTQSYPIGYKYNSATGVGSGNVTSDAWARGNYDSTEMSSDTIGYVTSSGGQISASNTELEISLGTGVPKYGYVLGPNYSAANGVLRIASSAKLYVTTNESDYSYTLAYNANGGSGAPGSETKTNTQVSPSCTFTISNTKPTKTGYTFSKWNTKANGTGTNYNPGDSITVTSAGTTTLYAIWTINTWQVKYDANGGTGAPAAQTKTYGVDLTLSSTIPTRANASAGSYTVTYNANSGSVSPASASAARTTSYSFKNWNTASGGGGTSYAPGGSYKANEAATMYAQWNANTSTASVTLPTPTRTGYNFNGWYTAASGGTKIGNAGASYTPTASITIYAQWTAAVGSPTFTTQPTSQSVYRGASVSLTVAATVSVGTITYKWQYSSNNSTWTDISGYTSTSLPLTTSYVGTSYRRCIATATNDGVSKSTISNSASVVVRETPVPSISTQPSSKSVNIGETASLSVSANSASGTLSYQWYSSSDNNTWSSISGATSSTYNSPTSSSGTIYYKVRITNTLNGYTAYVDSNSVSVTVSVDAPTFTTQPVGGDVFIGGSKTLTAVATAPYGTITYQWQKSSNNSSWSNISGATSASYTVPTSSEDLSYYRCVATATYSGKTPSTESNSVLVSVADVTTPVFTNNPISASYAYGVSSNNLTVLATSNGTITYQWQSSTNNANWSDISGATSTSYSPSTTMSGVMYYRCVATATGGTQTKTANSSSASITVVQASAPVFTYDLSSVDVTYNAGDVATVLNGTATVVNGTLSYQWYKSTDNGNTWFPIPGAQSATYQPSTNLGGTAYYRVVATNIVGTSSVSSTSVAAKVTIQNVILSYDAKWAQYINSVGKPFVKLARLDFLNPNGSVLFTLDNNPNNAKSGAFIQSGELSVNLQNGARRIATVTLSNLDGEFDYNVNKLWFGQQVRLWEGMILPSGQDFYVSQGVFYVKDPDEVFEPGLKQTTLTLVDKWAYLDGTLFGNLEGTYEVPLNSNVFNVIQSVLNLDRGNGQKIDSSVPIFTSYYNGKTTTLPDGSSVPLTNTPYTYRCDSENGTYADIVLEMNTMLAGWIGYDANGQLRLDPSQDDIIDTTKPVQWQFSTTNSTFLGATYSVKNSEVYNDIIIVGESLSEYGQTAGRATNYDPKSDTNANIIGLKTKRYQQAGYYTQDICESLAVFKLKRESVLKKSVSIKCSQLFHIQENNLVTIERTDKPGNPIERHLVVGYTRPIAQNREMVLNATSVMDQPVATITTAP